MFAKGPKKGWSCKRKRIKGVGKRWVCRKKKR